MREGLELWFGFVLNIALPILVIRADERYRAWLTSTREAERSARAARTVNPWNTASFWSAVIGFGPLALLVYFGRSRRSLAGWLLGVLWLLATATAIVLCSQILS